MPVDWISIAIGIATNIIVVVYAIGRVTENLRQRIDSLENQMKRSEEERSDQNELMVAVREGMAAMKEAAGAMKERMSSIEQNIVEIRNRGYSRRAGDKG